MRVVELIGDDIMKAYDGNYLSYDFGYSCANFNVGSSKKFNFINHNENDEATFDFYTKNTKNISCVVCYDDEDKIRGRRLFFKGPSMINDEEFEYHIKMGDEIKYMYGYYGSNKPEYDLSIKRYIVKKYNGVIHTDQYVLNNGRVDKSIINSWIMKIDNVKFSKYPPVDHLSVSVELSALSNFEPSGYIVQVLEKDFNLSGFEFHQAYRFKHGQKKFKHKYTTWSDHRGNISDSDDNKKPEIYDIVQNTITDDFFVFKGEEGDYYILERGDGSELKINKNYFNYYYKIF